MSEDEIPATPLAVLLRLMREKWLAGDHDGAANLARAAAPYTHPKVTMTAAKAVKLTEVHLLRDAELARQIALLTEGEPAPTDGTNVTN